MMHECKRLLNDTTVSDGLVFPGRRATRRDAGIAHLLVVPRAAAAEAGAAAEHAAHDARDAASQHENASSTSADSGNDGAGEVNEPPCKRPRQGGDEVADEGDADDQDSEDNVCDLLAGGGAAFTDNKRQMFSNTYTHRDDWLHRGQTLSDMDYYHYARYIERAELPRKGSPEAFLNKVGVYHHFAGHYALASTHVQVLRRTPKTVQNVGPQCKRSSANKGEDNAMYKAYYHSLMHCPAADECANPLMYRPLLFPYIPDANAYLTVLQRTPHAERTALRFLPAWRARRSEIEVLADRAAEKRTAAMRVGVVHDTTAFKSARMPRSRLPAAAEPGFDARLRQVLR